ncbi:MAG: hypothetical protein IJV16_02230 [Lachnospiraceae bacterium]|nr:hypothetical protein [Lachnospiraceae bacterium]
MISFRFLIAPLLITLATELLIALILHVKGLRQYIVMIIMNLITNPAVNIIFRLISDRINTDGFILYLVIFILEVCVVISESYILRRFTKELSMKPFTLSVCINVSSFAAGLLFYFMLSVLYK